MCYKLPLVTLWLLAACILLLGTTARCHLYTEYVPDYVVTDELDEAAIAALDKPEQPELPEFSAAADTLTDLRAEFEGKNFTTDVAAAEAHDDYMELFNMYRYARPPIDPEYNATEDEYGDTSIADGVRKTNTIVHPNKDGHFVYWQGPAATGYVQRFKFVGTNLYGLAQLGWYSRADVTRVLQEFSRNGVNVVRTWCFGNGYGDYEPWRRDHPFQPTVGTYNEAAFQHLDYVLQQAAIAGVRLVCALNNNLRDFGGVDWYVNKLAGGGEKYKFYDNNDCKYYYKLFVRKMIERVNTVNGIRYKDDPAIFSWELVNEPVLENGYDTRKGRKPGAILQAWVCEMSDFIKNLGAKQMVAVGDEGYRADGRTNVPHFSWMNGGSKGADFIGNLACHAVSYGTVHFYPETFGIPPANATTFVRDFLADRAEIARVIQKPIVLEEYGMTQGYMSSRNELFTAMTNVAFYHGYAGTMVWQLHLDHLKPRGNLMEIGFRDDGAQSIRSQVQYVNGQNGRNAPATPKPTTPPCINLRNDCWQQTGGGSKCWNYIAGECRQTCGMCKHWSGWDSSVPGGRQARIIQ